MDVSEDPYEQKLYQLFTSHDVESKGSLDKESLSKLCQTLELKEREPELIANLLNNGGQFLNRVTFVDFKEGLLNLLGTVGDATDKHNGDYGHIQPEISVHNRNCGKSGEHLSPSREVSPKFIVGTKKYGRRTRPQIATVIDSSQSESEGEFVFVATAIKPDLIMAEDTAAATANKSQKVQRSSSHSDLNGSSVRRRPASGTKLKRCASLPSQKPQKKDEKPTETVQRESSVESLGNLDVDLLSRSLYDVWNNYENGTNKTLNQCELEAVCERVGLQKIASKLADEVFEKLGLQPDSRISFNNFIALIQDIPTTTDDDDDDDKDENYDRITNDDSGGSSGIEVTEMSSRIIIQTSSNHEMHVVSDNWPTESSAVPTEVIIDMWTTAGIPNSKALLDNLGFATKEIQISQLSLAIDDDLQGMQNCTENNTVTSLLRASLALHKAEVGALQQAFRQLAEENRKLHATNRDANRRSALLAQEVDERHAHLENTARAEIRLLEQRHTEIVKDLTAKLANDREHWSSLNSRIEIRVKSLETEDAKLRTDIVTMQQENSALESEQMNMQKQIADLLVENKKLNYDLIDLMEKHRDEESLISDKQSEEVLELLEKITILQMENATLRDKNDELTSEVEDKTLEIIKFKTKKQAASPGKIDSAEGSLADIELSSSATKRRGDSPSKAKITEESPKLGKLRKCSNNNAEDPESENSGDWMTLNSELNQSITGNSASAISQELSSLTDSKDEEIKQLKSKIAELENSEKNAPPETDDGLETIKERNTELEVCLEQMRKEFEDCEDYWQGKLSEERQLYEEEQRITNENFNDLLKKMTEYEEQFAKDEQNGRLSPIDEKCQLEQQYSELEAETEEIKLQARKMLDEKKAEIETLQMEITKLKLQMGKSVDVYDGDSPASSPISYLWHQSTIQAPVRDYQNPNWNSTQKTAIDIGMDIQDDMITKPISPIQRPVTPSKDTVASGDLTNGDAISVKSHESNSVASTHSIHRSFPEVLCSSPNVLREDIKRLKLMELQLKDAIQELAQQRDCLVTEVEQLQEVKPMLTKAYARTNHPSLMQKIQHLEQKNRQLLNSAKQQQMYTESILQQTWQQQTSEINELRHRLEAQGIIIAEQAQRLANADVLVKDLYVENSQLSAAVQRLEQQRSRNNIILQHQGLTVVPGLP